MLIRRKDPRRDVLAELKSAPKTLPAFKVVADYLEGPGRQPHGEPGTFKLANLERKRRPVLDMEYGDLPVRQLVIQGNAIKVRELVPDDEGWAIGSVMEPQAKHLTGLSAQDVFEVIKKKAAAIEARGER